jgi:flagellar motor switch protein FliN/FliY
MSDALLSQAEIDALLKELPSGGAEPVATLNIPDQNPINGGPFSVKEPQKKATDCAQDGAHHPNLDRILDIPLQIKVNLGQATRQVEDVISLVPGAIVEFDREVGEPVDIVLNGKLIARGEVVVVDEHFGVRIIQIISPQERVQKMA